MRKNIWTVAGMAIALGLLSKPVWAMSCHDGAGMTMDSESGECGEMSLEKSKSPVTNTGVPVAQDKTAGDEQCPEMNTTAGSRKVPDTQPEVKKEKASKKTALTKPKKGARVAVYHCPMHPEVMSAQPGKCPECGMFLEKK